MSEQERVRNHSPAESPESSTTVPANSPFDERIFNYAIGGGILVIVLIFALVFGRNAANPEAIQNQGNARQLIDFSLLDQWGRSVCRTNLSNKYLVVNFVFASCTLGCLEVNQQMAEIQRRVAGQPDVCLVSLTVDPQSDTPPVLANFGNRFGADADRWLLLSGDQGVIYPLISQSFLGPRDPELANLIPGGWPRIDQIAIVDPKGHVRAYIEGLQRGAADKVIETLNSLRNER